jgi:hypothetical protein
MMPNFIVSPKLRIFITQGIEAMGASGNDSFYFIGI